MSAETCASLCFLVIVGTICALVLHWAGVL
jgi:hypothetical protein